MGILRFQKIKRSTVFCADFDNLTSNNIIDFENKNITVVYAPNGVGKTSLTKVFDNEQGSELEATYNERTNLRGVTGIFHTINDQNGRNIIQGKTEDFIMGDDIRHERELRKSIDEKFRGLKNRLIAELKNHPFGITKASSRLINRISDLQIQGYVRDLANSRSKGKSIKVDEFIEYVSGLTNLTAEVNEDYFSFLIEDFNSANPMIPRIENLTVTELVRNEHIREVEENNDAIVLLNKYIDKQQCVVCDNDIDNPHELLEHKTLNKSTILESLDDRLRTLIESIIFEFQGNDPFEIKNVLTDIISSGELAGLQTLKAELSRLFVAYSSRIINLFTDSLNNDIELINQCHEYQELLASRLIITDEDMRLIERMLNDNLEKQITLIRDPNTNEIELLLDNKEFLGRERPELHLSTGEQNFISLVFEFIKAKNSDKSIIVIDDPVSSFDSIYKNKIVYTLLKILEAKKIFILTHNTDLIRLLEVQKQNCFNMYIFNNIIDEVNGFILVGEAEKEKVIFINKMLDFLRSDYSDEVVDERLLLFSLIPFMRGYAQFIGNRDAKNNLTLLMHGYNTNVIDLKQIYFALFGTNMPFRLEHLISVTDILEVDVETINIFNETFPLINRILKNTFIYFYLRLLVEKVLVDHYDINTERYQRLGDIIFRAFRSNDDQDKRIFFMSRKTLLNEFNHFEGNINIVQPAIDISETNLQREMASIIEVLGTITA